MKFLSTLLLGALFLCAPISAQTGKTLKVMIVDTGVDGSNLRLKRYIPKNLRGTKHAKDSNGHGTHVFGLIADKACLGVELIPCKAFPPESLKGKNSDKKSMNYSKACLKAARDLKVDIVNYSAGGNSYDEEEHKLVKELNQNGTILVAATGNNNADIRKAPYYPAAYSESNILAVGALNGKTKLRSSNYGKSLTVWEQGANIESDGIGGKRVPMSGTSMAAAKVTARLVDFFCKKAK